MGVSDSEGHHQASEEYLHRPGEDPLWSESHYFDFVDDEIQGHVRIGFYPNLGRANAWVYCFLDSNRQLGWHDESIPLSNTHGTSLQADKFELDYRPLKWEEAWQFEFTGVLGDVDADSPPGTSVGESVPVRSRLTLHGLSAPFFYSDGHGLGDDAQSAMPEGTDRYEQPVRVEGDFVVEDRRWTIASRGERDHSWGPRDWFGMNWIWCSGHFKDGTAFNLFRLLDFEDYLNGFWFDGSRTVPLRTLEVTTRPDFGPGTARSWSRGEADVAVDLDMGWEEGDVSVRVEPFATTPIRWDQTETGSPECVESIRDATMLFNRSACRLVRSGGSGNDGKGYLEYGQQLTAH